MKHRVLELCTCLMQHFAPKTFWWPGDSALEIALGAILTQNTNWNNVEKALHNLRSAGLLDAEALMLADDSTLIECVRPSGFFKQKTARIRRLMEFFKDNCDFDFAQLKQANTASLREKLLAIRNASQGKEQGYLEVECTFYIDVHDIDRYLAGELPNLAEIYAFDDDVKIHRED